MDPRVADPLKQRRASRPKLKTGCNNCKNRRIKCDETTPQCIKSYERTVEIEIPIAPRPHSVTDHQEKDPGAGPKVAMAMSRPGLYTDGPLPPEKFMPVDLQWDSSPVHLATSNANPDWVNIQLMESIVSDDEGFFKSSKATRQAGLDPRSLRMCDDEIPSLMDQEERRCIEAKSLEIEEWRSQAGGDSDEGEQISVRSSFETYPFESLYNERSIGSDEGSNVRPLEDGWSIHENRLLEGQVYYTKKVWSSATIADLELLALPRHWHDAPSFPEATTTTFQPTTSNEASMRWNILSDNISISSRAATWGSRRPSLTDASEYDLDSNNFVEKVPDLPNTEKTRQKTSIFDQGLDRLANIVRMRSDSKLKRDRSSQNISEETGNQLHAKQDSKGTLAPPSSSPISGLTSINTALAAMAGPLAAVGRSHTRIDSLSPLSPVEHLTFRKDFMSRGRSKSELNFRDQNAPIGLAALLNRQGGPPVAKLASDRPSMGSEDESEDSESASAYYGNLGQMSKVRGVSLGGSQDYSTSDKPGHRFKASISDDDEIGVISPISPPPNYIHSPIDSSKSGQMIRASVLQGLSDSATAHAGFTIHWDLRAFIRDQYEDVPNSVDSIITLSGSAVAAQATTCQDYVHTNWPICGSRVLVALQEAFDSSDNTSTSHSPRLSVFINLAASVILVNIQGFKETIVEVAQLFAWMGAAIHVSSNQQVQYSNFKLDVAAQGKFEMKFETAPLEKDEQSCWYPLFVNPVIARGFPVPPRENNEVGLEVTLELMAVLTEVRYVIEYEGGLLLKGPVALYVPIKRHKNSIQWHFIHYNEPSTRMAYSEVKNHCPWWKASRTYLGTNDYDYKVIVYSTAAPCSRTAKVVGGALGFSKIGIGMNISLGAKDSQLFLSRAGPLEQIMQWAEMMPILLYDVTEKRGWFVKARVVPLLGADLELNGDEASENAILRMSLLKLFKDDTKRDKEYYLADLVVDIWAILEVLSKV
ncbi:hypothetical protein V8E51_001562 [Hyaloscypha variabilis]